MHKRKFWDKDLPLRMWSAGCSSGEEPYSLAMSICETWSSATDWKSAFWRPISAATPWARRTRESIARACWKIFRRPQIDKYFSRSKATDYKVKPKIREMVKFAPMNLAEPLYLGRFDCIFCMNVLIYFSEALRSRLIQRFYEYLEPGGYLFLGHAESVANVPVRFNQTFMQWRPAVAEADDTCRQPGAGCGGGSMNGPGQEMIELFLQEASEHLQFLREYSGILQDPYPLYEDIERLYISAHGVAGTGGTYGYEFFNEVASKLAHIFQYAMNATIGPEATAPLVEFIYEAIAVLESDLHHDQRKRRGVGRRHRRLQAALSFAFQGPPPVAADAPTEQPHPPESRAHG